METKLIEKTKVKFSASRVVTTSLVAVSGVICISLFLAAMTIPIFPIAHSTGKVPKKPISNFEECVNAGNPVLESSPRQCNGNGKIFIEEFFEIEYTDTH